MGVIAAPVDPPAPDRTSVETFLRESVGCAIHIVAIAPEGLPRPYGRWFGDDAAGAAEWAIRENVKGYGVYWTANVTRIGVDKKPSKEEIEAARFLHVDIDPPKDGSEFDRIDLRARAPFHLWPRRQWEDSIQQCATLYTRDLRRSRSYGDVDGFET